MWPSHKEEGRWGHHLSGQNVAKPDENDLLAAPYNKQTAKTGLSPRNIFKGKSASYSSNIYLTENHFYI